MTTFLPCFPNHQSPPSSSSSSFTNTTTDLPYELDYNRLNEVVQTISSSLSDPNLRQSNNRAVQAVIWSNPKVASYMTDLRRAEEVVRAEIMGRLSTLIHGLHQRCISTTLVRANIIPKDSSTKSKSKSLDVRCLDAKERLYLILKEYNWIKDFFRLYPMHFFENSFTFINNIPHKQLTKNNIKVKVVGLGVGGSLAVSGLKKRGIEYVVGYDKRQRFGERSVTSRYQNASWRAYDIASGLLDEEAYEELVAYQQKITVYDNDDDGNGNGNGERVIQTDRVQIILGSAIDSALASAERYGADLRFGSKLENFYNADNDNDNDNDKHSDEDESEENENEKVDIVALFTGAHTSEIFDGLKDQMQIHQWPTLSSSCKMWLQIKPTSKKRHAYTARDVEVGAENWHFAIESARKTIVDVKRIRDSLLTQYNLAKQRAATSTATTTTATTTTTTTTTSPVDGNKLAAIEEEYKQKLDKIDTLIQTIEAAQEKDKEARFDYIFANAPDNEHNRSKIDAAKNDGNVVIDGNYQVDIKIASRSAIYAHEDDHDHDHENENENENEGDNDDDDKNNNSNSQTTMMKKKKKKLCDQFSSKLVVMGGDACVPPNPMAAYGATLACEFAEMLVQLAVAHGHLNTIEKELVGVDEDEDKDKDVPGVDESWGRQVKELKALFTKYYDARGRAENYFQWMQTLICNLYSLPPSK